VRALQFCLQRNSRTSGDKTDVGRHREKTGFIEIANLSVGYIGATIESR
jgi:hypothetical protein